MNDFYDNSKCKQIVSEKVSGEPSAKKRAFDPRLYQIAILSFLLAYGTLALDFDLEPTIVAILLAGALGTQWLAGRWVGLTRFDPRSALISGLSLVLLLRTQEPAIAFLAAFLAIGSKFVLRRQGKHIWNPTNFALVGVLLLPEGAWVSPGQWGSTALWAFAVACLGMVVTLRAERSDVTWAFLLSYGGLLFGRALWLGDPWSIPQHQLASGAFLIFTFFMISDPKTTPDSRLGRILYAFLVACLAMWIRFGLYHPNDLIWALVLSAPLVPILDYFVPAARYQWPGFAPRPVTVTVKPKKSSKPQKSSSLEPTPRRTLMHPVSRSFLVLTLILFAPIQARAFCGFYVAKADTSLFNRASKVVIVRDEDRTVLTMANDYQGSPAEFAMVVPVPTFLEREQIHVGDRAVIEHLDAYTAPRLVEYFDPDPCAQSIAMRRTRMMAESAPMMAMQDAEPPVDDLGVTIEARYAVGEYDILILSAEESRGLETWLRQNGYRVPEGASRVLGSYLKQNMRFFVAKVNLKRQEDSGFSFLRPLQVAYESPKFMLPVRLGTLNAEGPQELFVFLLNRSGRVETTNYRTIKLPSDAEIPPFVKTEFADFYRALFDRQAEQERLRAVFLEYAWDMAWCDPCAADPLSDRELRELGVFWIDGPGNARSPVKLAARDVFVTRLHLRYTADTFPEDLFFQETGDRTNFQGRYILRHPWRGSPQECVAAGRYFDELRQRQEREAQTLASLTGWELEDIRQRLELPMEGRPVPSRDDNRPWWKKLWGSGS